MDNDLEQALKEQIETSQAIAETLKEQNKVNHAFRDSLKIAGDYFEILRERADSLEKNNEILSRRIDLLNVVVKDLIGSVGISNKTISEVERIADSVERISDFGTEKDEREPKKKRKAKKEEK